MRNKQNGFTLIEIMIAIAIIGILAGIAVPQYGKFVTESRRTDAHVALRAAAQEMERCRTQTFTYVDCTLKTASTTSEAGYYDIEIDTAVTASSSAFGLKATATTGKSQAGDTACTPMTINAKGETDPADCW